MGRGWHNAFLKDETRLWIRLFHHLSKQPCARASLNLTEELWHQKIRIHQSFNSTLDIPLDMEFSALGMPLRIFLAWGEAHWALRGWELYFNLDWTKGSQFTSRVSKPCGLWCVGISDLFLASKVRTSWRRRISRFYQERRRLAVDLRLQLANSCEQTADVDSTFCGSGNGRRKEQQPQARKISFPQSTKLQILLPKTKQ
jgi:hypothetical protein